MPDDTRLTGVVASLRERTVRTTLTAPATAGSTTLVVADNVTIEAGDTVVLLEPDTQATTSAQVAAVLGETFVVLTAPLSAGWPIETLVTPLPEATEVTAFVRLDGNLEPVPCRVDHALGDALQVGVRDETLAETVAVDRVDGSLQVVDVLARATNRPDLAADIDGATTEARSKSKVTYSTSPPGASANQLGDVWFVWETIGGTITQQYQGLGGTSWERRKFGQTALSADAIDGLTITGALFRTSGSTDVDRITFDSAGIRTFLASGALRFEVKTTGEVMAYGDDTSGGVFASLGATRTSRMTQGQFVAQTISNGQFGFPIMSLGPNQLKFQGPPPGNHFQQIYRNAANEGLYLETTGGPMVLTSNGTMQLMPLVNNSAIVQTTGNGAISLIATGSGNINLGTDGTAGEVRSLAIFDKTTSLAANVRIENAGALRRVSSSRRYKTGIRDLVVDDLAIFGDGTEEHPGLRPVTFYDKAALARYEAADSPDEPAPRRIPGVIAEEVAALDLGILVELNEDGEPESVSYDRFLPVLLPALKRDHQRIAALENEVAELKQLVTQLLNEKAVG